MIIEPPSISEVRALWIACLAEHDDFLSRVSVDRPIYVDKWQRGMSWNDSTGRPRIMGWEQFGASVEITAHGVEHMPLFFNDSFRRLRHRIARALITQPRTWDCAHETYNGMGGLLHWQTKGIQGGLKQHVNLCHAGHGAPLAEGLAQVIENLKWANEEWPSRDVQWCILAHPKLVNMARCLNKPHYWRDQEFRILLDHAMFIDSIFLINLAACKIRYVGRRWTNEEADLNMEVIEHERYDQFLSSLIVCGLILEDADKNLGSIYNIALNEAINPYPSEAELCKPSKSD